MRCILLLLDGLGDRSHAALGYRTPLQAAHTPNLDQIATLGMNGLFHPHLQGTALPSELAHFLMFGYRMEEFPGRGAVEALGEGLDIQPGDVALLARIFSVAQKPEGLVLRQESPVLEQNDCQALQQAVRRYSSDGIEGEFLPTGGIGGILRLRGAVSKYVTDSNPITKGRCLMEVLPWHSHANDLQAQNTARFLNAYLRWSHRTLSQHPLNAERRNQGLPVINAVGTQRAGMLCNLPSFTENWGLKGLMIASGALYQGIGQVVGMDTHKVADSEAIEGDLRQRLQMAYYAKDYDFVHVHSKLADEAGHSGDPLRKKRVIEAIDRALAFALDSIVIDEQVLFVVTADHSTAASGTMIHTGESVPLVMTGSYVRRDAVTAFNEISCAGGGLGLVRGKELMYLVLNFLDRGKLWGLMDAPQDQPFTPGPSVPLRID